MKRRAILLPASDQGLQDLAYRLLSLNLELVASDVAGRALAMAGLPVTPVEFATKQAKLVGGRAAPLHYSLHAGIAADSSSAIEIKQLENARIPLVDVVVAHVPQAPEDFGDEPLVGYASGGYTGVAAAISAGISRADRVVVLVDPADYDKIPDAVGDGGDALTLRVTLAAKAARHLATFHSVIGELFAPGAPDVEETSDGPEFGTPAADIDLQVPDGGLKFALGPVNPPSLPRSWRAYEDLSEALTAPAQYDVLHGEPPTITRQIDLDVALCTLDDMPAHPTSVVAINGHVCAVASSPKSSMRALLRAIGADPIAARGGVLAFNGRVDETLARALMDFEHAKGLHIVAADAFDEEAAMILSEETDRTLIELPRVRRGRVRARLKATRFGVYIEPVVGGSVNLGAGQVATETPPPTTLGDAANLAFRVARNCAGVATVICDGFGTLGMSSGQAHATDAIQIATAKARRANRACVAVIDRGISSGAAAAALARAQVKLVVLPVNQTPDEVYAALDASEIAAIEVADGWRTLR